MNAEQKLAAIAALHRKETRWTNSATEEYTSYDTREEAEEAYLEACDVVGEKPTIPLGAIDTFDLCAECARVERESWEGQGDEWAYLSSHWPCRTAAVLDAPSVSAARAGGIDRDALRALLVDRSFLLTDPDDCVDRLLALVQPAPPIQAAVTDTMGLNPLGDRLGEHGFDADDVEVILQDVAAFFGIDDEAEPTPPVLDLAVVRRVLTAALPADLKWAVWVDGRIEEIAALGEVSS